MSGSRRRGKYIHGGGQTVSITAKQVTRSHREGSGHGSLGTGRGIDQIGNQVTKQVKTMLKL